MTLCNASSDPVIQLKFRRYASFALPLRPTPSHTQPSTAQHTLKGYGIGIFLTYKIANNIDVISLRRRLRDFIAN